MLIDKTGNGNPGIVPPWLLKVDVPMPVPPTRVEEDVKFHC